MRSIKTLITVSAFSLVVLCLPAIASAQYGGYGYPNGQYDPYGRNGSYGNGQYGTYGNYGGDMRSIVRDLKNRTREFQRQLDRDLDHSRLNGSRREDEINNTARRFRDAVNRINDNNNYGRRDGNVDRALQLGSQLDREIARARVSYQAQNLWQGVRQDLQMLGNGYFDNNNRNNRSNRGIWGNGTSNRPSWWPF